MVQKYPNKKTPYKYQRSTIPQCCRTRLGTIKKRFDTEAEALHKSYEFEGSYGVYPCSSGNGYHIRTKRKESR